MSASAEARSLLGRALQALAQDLYVGSGALLAELIQNADDCTFDAAVVPTLTLTQTADALVLESNEAGFTTDNVRALCDVGRSTKRGSAAIGRKGARLQGDLLRERHAARRRRRLWRSSSTPERAAADDAAPSSARSCR